MPTSAETNPRRLDIRKYSNRRFYDATHSQPVTQEQIFRYIRDGYEVRVTDAKTGEDITVRVLAQIILDMDDQKLAVFPVELLHRIIQSNEKIMHDFVDKYFNQALMVFLESRQKFDEHLRGAVGLGWGAPPAQAWANLMNNPFMPTGWPNQPPPDNRPAEPAARPAETKTPLETTVQELREQLDALKKELASRRRPAAKPKRARAK